MLFRPRDGFGVVVVDGSLAAHALDVWSLDSYAGAAGAMLGALLHDRLVVLLVVGMVGGGGRFHTQSQPVRTQYEPSTSHRGEMRFDTCA